MSNLHKTEAQTRREMIDKDISRAGWRLSDPTQVAQELDILLSDAGHPKIAEPRTPYEGHQFVDYALMSHNKPLAVIEAKKTSRDARLGQEQAMQYAQNLQKKYGGPIPFVLYTNGYDIFYWESDYYPPVKVYGMPSKEDLEWLNQRREQRLPLSQELINTKTAGREYQVQAIRSVLEGLERKKRKFLLVMATGTGKTRTAIAMVDALIRAKWIRRVLFLVDRIALQEQTLDAFIEHMPETPRWPHNFEKTFDPERRIYVTTYRTMLNLIQQGTTPETWISPFFFDLIIADESHRSIYNIYKNVLNYFHGVKIGLTATPKDQLLFDTFKLFNCERGLPTFSYSFEEAVSHNPPYLCDFEVLNVRTKYQVEGIKGKELSDEARELLISEGLDPDDIDFEGTDLEKKVTNSGTNIRIIQEFMEECIKDTLSGTIPGKTIIFALSKAHARRLHNLFDQMYPEFQGRLAKVLVSEDSRVYGKGGLLDQFKNTDMPRIAISVDLLDTGVDIREVVNLVFLKPVYSAVKFWQMIGRGTRMLDPARLKPWCTEKDKFLILDYWKVFEYFKMKPQGRQPAGQEPLPVKLFRTRLRKLESALRLGEKELPDKIISSLRLSIKDLPLNNISVKEKKREIDTISGDDFWRALKTDKLAYLRQTIAPIFQASSQEDFKAMQFAYAAESLWIAWLEKQQDLFNGLKESILEQISELPFTIREVQKEEIFIGQVSDSAWWQDLSNEKLENLILKLSPLMRYRQARPESILKLNLQDLTAVKDYVEFGPNHERMATAAYRERVEQYIQSLVDENLILQKIKAGADVSVAELKDLAELLEKQSLHITEETLQKVYDHKRAKFLQLMRHVLGLEILPSWSETVTKAFDNFIVNHNTLTVLQMQFLQTLKTFILQNGSVNKSNLIQPPFTNFDPQGIRALFKPSQINEIIQFTDQLGQ